MPAVEPRGKLKSRRVAHPSTGRRHFWLIPEPVDPVANPPATILSIQLLTYGRDASGRLSRKITGEVRRIALPTKTVSNRDPSTSLRINSVPHPLSYWVQGSPLPKEA